MKINFYIVIILLVSIMNFAQATFEQDGVKEGNSRFSISLYSEKHADANYMKGKVNLLYSKFLSDDIETFIHALDNLTDNIHTYKLDAGLSYYFLKRPTLTPYIGLEMGLSGDSTNGIKLFNEQSFYIGTHKFFSENIALTPELGIEFIDFKIHSETYFNLYFTYFFN